MAENQPPSSASHTTPHPPLPPTFRPSFPTRSSYNYAHAEAQARSERGVHASSDALTGRKASVDYGDGDGDAEGERSGGSGGSGEKGGSGGSGGKGEGKGGSWSEQDMKRVMQERLLGGEVGRERGFSEK